MGFSFDVVVVGGGGAGLSAALEAARLGRSVLVIEKMPYLLGTTGRSVGSVTATSTALQKSAGIDDFPKDHFDDMAKFGEAAQPDASLRDNLELRRLLVENVPETVRQLTAMGVTFIGPMPEPPHGRPRMHNIIPHSRAYIYHLERACRKAGVTFLLDTRVTRLIAKNERVAGVEAISDGKSIVVEARCGVVLAAGDYSSSKEMKARFVSNEIADIEGINPNSTGDGHAMALELGAEIVMGQVMLGPEIRFVAPQRKKLIQRLPPSKSFAQMMRIAMNILPNWLLRPFFMMFVTTNLSPSLALFDEGAVLVNKLGKRFVNERDRPQLAIAQQPDRIAFILMDDSVARKFSQWPHFVSTAPGVAYAYVRDYKRSRGDIYATANTIEELAVLLKVPPETLRGTIDAYNVDLPPGAPPIAKPPFHALGPAKSWIVLTDGGLKVSTRLEVLDKSGKAIPGLFAAGSNGQGGLLLEGHGHHLGWAFTSGRLAGRSAASSSQ
ncbi:MAG: FAD-dependent oxidoreductase [Pseudolabrys sp.]